MKLNYTYSRLLWVNKNKARNGEAPIYLRITIDGKRTEIATKKWVALDKWNPSTQTVRGNTEEIRVTNTFLQTLLSKVDRIHFDLSLQDRIPTPDEIKNQLFGVDERPKHKTICEAFEYHNLKMADMVKIGKTSPKTLLRYEITKNKVVAYMERKFKVSDMALPEMRLAFITEFEHHLLTVDKIQSNTAYKYIKNLKKIMNMAVGLDWIPNNPFNLFKCSYVSTSREILNQEELDVEIYYALNDQVMRSIILQS